MLRNFHGTQNPLDRHPARRNPHRYRSHRTPSTLLERLPLHLLRLRLRLPRRLPLLRTDGKSHRTLRVNEVPDPILLAIDCHDEETGEVVVLGFYTRTTGRVVKIRDSSGMRTLTVDGGSACLPEKVVLQ